VVRITSGKNAKKKGRRVRVFAASPSEAEREALRNEPKDAKVVDINREVSE